jgi:glycine betaine/choline ABC-type transport system substrate-binding protein
LWRSARETQQNGHITVGSKDFTESASAREIVSRCSKRAALRLSGAFELGGNLPHDALVDRNARSLSRIHRHVLHRDPSSRADLRSACGLHQVKQEYAEKFKVDVSQPLGFENTFAILVRGDEAES